MTITGRSGGDHTQAQHAVLVPGSLWSYRSQWQPYVEMLPTQTVLIVEPARGTPLHRVLELVAAQLLAAGHPVRRLAADTLGPQHGIQAPLPLP
jgi:hypothetical protein